VETGGVRFGHVGLLTKEAKRERIKRTHHGSGLQQTPHSFIITSANLHSGTRLEINDYGHGQKSDIAI
jgi:hypothetical protein